MDRQKPIEIVKVKNGYHVFVNDVPVVRDGTKVSIDRIRAGLKVGEKYEPPSETTPALFKKAGDAAHVAHLVGNYIMQLGDFVSTYTKLTNVLGNHESWWHRALH